MAITVSNTDLRVDISNRQIFKIALPITLALLVPQINFVANTVFLGQLGESELGTAGITGVYYLVFALIGNGLNSGLQALIARRAGENRPLEIGKMFAQSIWLALLYAAAGILITYLLAPPFFQVALDHDYVRDEAAGFIRIRIWGLPFLYLFQVANALLVGTNNSRYMKYGFIVAAGFNILLDYLLIYGHWGMPKLGFDGAAVASVIAEAISMVVVFLIIIYKQFHHRFSLFIHMRLNKPLFGLIFRQSSPLVMQYVLSVSAWLLFYIMIEHYDTKRPLAISNTMRNVFAVFGVFTWAFAQTSNAMVSNIIGQGKKEKVLFLANKIMWLSVAFSASLCLIVNLFPHLFLSIYSTDKSFITDAVPVLRMVSVGITLMAVATVWLNAVTGTGNTRVNLLIEIFAIILYTIYVYFVLHVWKMSMVWAWASELLYWVCIFTPAFFYMKSGKWKSKVI